jgi:hypothetical protein
VPAWEEAGLLNIPAVVSLLVSVAYGAIASAILPGNLGYDTPRNWGPVPLECWVTAGALYVALVAVFRDHRSLAFSRYALEASAPGDEIVDIATAAEKGELGTLPPTAPAPAAGA